MTPAPAARPRGFAVPLQRCCVSIKAVPGKLLQIGLWAAIFAGAALAQSTLTGRVLALADGERTPAAGAWVVASAGSPPRTVAAAQADPRGAYQLGGLPEGRVEFTVVHRGYFTLESGGAASPTLARICPTDGSCGEADFVVAKASVVDGYLINPFGDPVSGTQIRLTPLGQGEDETRSRYGAFRSVQQTDDQGYFRSYGVPAGEYDLTVELQQNDAEAYTVEPERIRVETGVDQSLYISLAVASDPVRIGGSIAGLDLADGETVWIIAASSGGGGRYPRLVRVDTPQGAAARLSGEVPPGDYELTAEIRRPDSGRGPEVDRRVPLGRYRIDRDMMDLQLKAHAGATFRGRVRFDGIPQQRAGLSLVPLDERGAPVRYGFPSGPNGRFQRIGLRWGRVEDLLERRALTPGRYRLESDAGAYFIASETEFVLSEGQTLETEIVLSGAFAEIRGVVRPPQIEGAAGPFLVAIKAPDGKVVSMQTDTDGRYSFVRLAPGDYAICAWSDRAARPQEESTWTTAGVAVRRFPVAAGDQTEILLTAKP